MNQNQIKSEVKSLEARLQNADVATFIAEGKAILDRKNNEAPIAQNPTISGKLADNGESAPMVVTGDAANLRVATSLNLVFYNCLNWHDKQFIDKVKRGVDAYERKLKYA